MLQTMIMVNYTGVRGVYDNRYLNLNKNKQVTSVGLMIAVYDKFNCKRMKLKIIL